MHAVLWPIIIGTLFSLALAFVDSKIAPIFAGEAVIGAILTAWMANKLRISKKSKS